MKLTMDTIKSISLTSVIWIFSATLIPILISVYVIWPSLVAIGIPFFVGYLICFQVTPFIFIFAYAIMLYKKEGNPMTWKAFKERMRLKCNGKILLSGIAAGSCKNGEYPVICATFLVWTFP